jgi:hypothetical protein
VSASGSGTGTAETLKKGENRAHSAGERRMTGRGATITAFFVAAALLVVGTLAAAYQWQMARGQVVAALCLVAGLLVLAGATFFWLLTGPDKTADVVAEGQIVLGTAAGLVLVLWGQAFIALGFISSWRLLYPSKQSGPILVGGGMPGMGDVVQLMQALTVAPTWLGMTVVGMVLTGAGAWVIRHSRLAVSIQS